MRRHPRPEAGKRSGAMDGPRRVKTDEAGPGAQGPGPAFLV